MKRHLEWSLVLVIQVSSAATAGEVTFEDLGLAPNSYVNNAPGGNFSVDGNQFNNSYDPTFGVWSGWAISSMTDTTTPGFTNQYSAITGSGADGSQTYAVAYPFGDSANPFHPASSWINLPAGDNPVSIDVTNTTYAYLSMLKGDSFENAFTAGSFFKLDIAGWSGANGTGTQIGDVTFYLANGTDIINTWRTISLTALSGSESLVFGLQSSENDPVFGMNTPAFFAADNFVEAVPEPGALVLLATGLVAVWALRWKKSWSQSAPAA